MIKIVETNDISTVVKTVEHFGGETLGIDKTIKAWFALAGKNIIGTVGVIKLNRYNWVLEPLAVMKKYRNKGIEERLITRAMSYLEEIKARLAFCMTKYVKAYQKFGFKKINLEDVPKNLRKLLRKTSCEACFRCSKYVKTCFPALMMLKLR